MVHHKSKKSRKNVQVLNAMEGMKEEEVDLRGPDNQVEAVSTD